jgi:transcriptional regulator with XRE-family HTH domain
MEFRDRLRTIRAVRDVTQGQLATSLGLNPSIIGKLETGDVRPSRELEARIRQALNWGQAEDAALEMLAEPQPEGAPA